MRNFRPLPWQAENLKHQSGAPTAVAAAVAHLTAPDVRHVRVNDILSCMFYPNRWLQNMVRALSLVTEPVSARFRMAKRAQNRETMRKGPRIAPLEQFQPCAVRLFLTEQRHLPPHQQQ